MENVLYEYHFDVIGFLPNFIPLFVGAGFLLYSICAKRAGVGPGYALVDRFFGIIGFIVGPLAIGLFIVLTYGTVAEHIELKERLASDDVLVVEGYVENYHPMPAGGHDTEHFEIDGSYFEYSDYVMTNGYHHAASLGGVVTRNGQYLKIKYVVREYDEMTENVILYIAEIALPK